MQEGLIEPVDFKPEKRVYEGYGDVAVWMVPFSGHRRSIQSQIELENAQLLTSITQKNVYLTSIFGVHSVDMIIAGSVQNCIFTVMEWVCDKDLFDIFMEDKTVWTDCKLLLKLYEHMKDALLFMHKHGVYHLDVKPENIMYTRQGVFKLCDFGSVTTTRYIVQNVENGCGTVYYRAPELRHVGVGIEAPPLDLWSLGMVLYVIKRNGFFPESYIFNHYMTYKRMQPSGCDSDFFTSSSRNFAMNNCNLWTHGGAETRQYTLFTRILSHLLAFDPSMRKFV